MDGGATGGYWAIGSWVIATPPTTSTKSAITHAKIRRAMKNLAMALDLPRAGRQRAAEAEDAAGAADGADAAAGIGTGADAAPGCHGTGFTVAPGRSFWKPSTITFSPGSRPPVTTHCVPRAEATLTGRGV